MGEVGGVVLTEPIKFPAQVARVQTLADGGMAEIMQQKRCHDCEQTKSIDDFYANKTKKDGYNSRCKDCARVYNKARYEALRRRVLDAYGAVCACCSEERSEFLAIDHVHGSGNKERQRIGWTNLYEYLNRLGCPDKDRYRVLCHNCNMAFGLYGYCPHQNE